MHYHRFRVYDLTSLNNSKSCLSMSFIISIYSQYNEVLNVYLFAISEFSLEKWVIPEHKHSLQSVCLAVSPDLGKSGCSFNI